MAANSAEAYKKVSEALTKENGEPIILEHQTMVKMEEGAIDKLKKLSGKVNG